MEIIENNLKNVAFFNNFPQVAFYKLHGPQPPMPDIRARDVDMTATMTPATFAKSDGSITNDKTNGRIATT